MKLAHSCTIALAALVLVSCGCACNKSTDAHAPSRANASVPRAVVEFAIVADPKQPAAEGARSVEYNGRSYTLEPARRFPIESTAVSQDDMGFPAVSFEIADAQKPEFKRWTAEHVRRGLAVLIDGKVSMIVTIQSPLPGGGIINSGNEEHWTAQQASELAARIAPAK
jgi:preprotein translocase subunit SecD